MDATFFSKSRVLYIWSNNLHLLCTFQRRLPSFSTLDEWLALISSDAAFFSNSWVARLFPNRWFWSCWNQKLIKNVSELILSIISIHGLAPPLSDFDRLLYPSFTSILLRAQDLSVIPTNDVILISHMICNCRFVSVRKRFFSAGPGSYLAANFFHFGLMFVETGAKLSPRFTNVDQVAVSTWSFINGMRGVELVSSLLMISWSKSERGGARPWIEMMDSINSLTFLMSFWFQRDQNHRLGNNLATQLLLKKAASLEFNASHSSSVEKDGSLRWNVRTQ